MFTHGFRHLMVTKLEILSNLLPKGGQPLPVYLVWERSELRSLDRPHTRPRSMIQLRRGISKCSMPAKLGLSAKCPSAVLPSIVILGERNTVNSSALTRLTSHRCKSGSATGRGRFRHMQVRSNQQTAQRVDMQVNKVKIHRYSLPQQTTAFPGTDT